MARESLQQGDAEQRDESRPGWDGAGQHIISSCYLNGTQLKTYELVISRIFRLIFLEHG